MDNHMKIPDEDVLLNNLGKISYTLDKAYLWHLADDYTIMPFDESFNKDDVVTYASNIRALKIKRWVYDKDENISDCFQNVMSVFSGSEKTLALAINRTPKDVSMYFVLKSSGQGQNEVSKNDIELLADSLRGNFPGTELSIVDSHNNKTRELFDLSQCCSVAALCNVPSDKSEKFISQGVDKLLNGIVPQNDNDSYWVIILAESFPQDALRQVLSGYQELATAIAPFASYQFQAGKNEASAEGEMESLSNTEGISRSITKTHSVNASLGFNKNAGVAAGGAYAGGGVNYSVGYGYSWGRSKANSTSDTKMAGTNRSVSLGSSESSTYSYKSFLVTDLVEKLEATIKRINESQATGLWRCASYVFSSNAKQSKNVANYLRALTQGEQSYIEPSYVQEWSQCGGYEKDTFSEIRKYVCHFCHPLFTSAEGIAVTPTTNVSTTELSKVFAFPRHSMQGIPVVECARFGREPHSLNKLNCDINLGSSYHMYAVELHSHIFLDRNVLTAHTFITGSTGAGKSNTIYTMLDKLCLRGSEKAHFLVVEPAKGEYKDVLGGYDGVSVYGTNPQKAPLLRLNPFSFPDDVHVLEHIDRLVEIFNACWPMYAAMPAVLKDAVEASYVSCGWSLTRSECKPKRFPTFSTVMKKLPEIIGSSAYSSDTKGDYTGALVTRIKSLTNGINGQIFCAEDEISNECLFDENVIVDISRVGSMETKALLMGIMVMKLQEYRMSVGGINQKLKHITVLEEAHNLLRRTSTEQTQESSNLQGKSVEMLANAIAEMRTYGEGFIIADQSPGLMDMSVIRNTNTKIIMRLPDESDRLLVGKAASLNDDQIAELAKLGKGVAAIYQNDWLEPVLCKVDLFDKPKQQQFEVPAVPLISAKEKLLWQITSGVTDGNPLTNEDVDQIKMWIDRVDTGREAKSLLLDALNGKALSENERGYLLYCLTKGKTVLGDQMKNAASVDTVRASVDSQISDMLNVSRGLAEEMRKLIFLYASQQVENDIKYRNELLYFGGVR